MKTVQQYLEKTSNHLFEFKSNGTGEITYKRILLNSDKTKFKTFIFDSDFNLIKVRERSVKDYIKVSPNGKSYLNPLLKYILFNNDVYGHKIKCIKRNELKFEIKYDTSLNTYEKVYI